MYIFHRMPLMPRLGAVGLSIRWACIMQQQAKRGSSSSGSRPHGKSEEITPPP